MTFTVNGTITRCAVGGRHYHVPIQIGAGATVTVTVDSAELSFDPTEDLDATREAIVARLRSAGKEANAVSFAQWRTALETKTFKL